MDCRTAREILAAPAPDGGWASARAHLLFCPACQARFDALAAASVSGQREEIPCAECVAGLGAYVQSGAAAGDPTGRQRLIAAHLAACPDCAATHADLAAALTGLRTGDLREPPAYPALDTSFLPRAVPTAPLLDRLRSALGGGSSPALGRWAVGALAVLLMAAVAWWALRLNDGPPPQQAAVPGLTTATRVLATLGRPTPQGVLPTLAAPVALPTIPTNPPPPATLASPAPTAAPRSGLRKTRPINMPQKPPPTAPTADRFTA